MGDPLTSFEPNRYRQRPHRFGSPIAKGMLQTNGQVAVEPLMDVAHVASAGLYMANLPLNTNVQFMTIMATEMPFLGRGRTLDAGRRSHIIRSTSIPFQSEGVVNSKNMPIRANVGRLHFREGIQQLYPDVLMPAAIEALETLAPLNAERRRIMRERSARRSARFREGRRIGFLDPAAVIPRTQISVQQARRGEFEGQRNSP